MSTTPDNSIPAAKMQPVDLPFVNDNNYWYVHPTGSYYADTALGKGFAQKLFEALEEHEVALNLLDWISESQAKHHTEKDKYMRSAFWYQIALAVRNGIIYTKRAYIEESERKQLGGGR